MPSFSTAFKIFFSLSLVFRRLTIMCVAVRVPREIEPKDVYI